MNEADWQAQIKDAARTFGWLYYHTRYSFGSDKGWPDTALIRPPRLVLAELKTERGKLTADQAVMLEALKQCTSVEAYVWRPGELDDVVLRALR
jgi:hypothetical protein